MKPFLIFGLTGILTLGMTGAAMAQENAPQPQEANQSRPGIHGPRSIDQELDHLTKDLELTPNQRKQVRPLLDEHHDKIQALFYMIPLEVRNKRESFLLTKNRSDFERFGFRAKFPGTQIARGWLRRERSMTRRRFGTLAAMGVASVGQTISNGMIYRTLGKTGEKVSAIGLGGYHIGHPPDPVDAIRIVRSAIDRGITFMDNCWDYHDGESERRMGIALRDGFRQKVFLMTKFDGRTKDATARQVNESLQRLQTDHIDLIQYHENIRLEDPDRFFATDGPLEALMEAKKAGKIRYIGFTGHKDPLVHLRMLEAAAQHNFHFDTCQMPLNVMDAHFRSFRHYVLPKLVEQGIGVLGMKSMGDGNILKSGRVTPVECLHYALNLPTSVVITGCERMAILDQAIEAARTFKPMSPTEVSALLAQTKDIAMSGQFEPFKTTPQFDGTAQHPQWMI